MKRSLQQQTEGELEQIRQRISRLVAARETLKQALESGRISPGDGLRRLERLDRDLSLLDTDFKNLWDAQRN